MAQASIPTNTSNDDAPGAASAKSGASTQNGAKQDAAVHAAGSFKPGALKWGYFLLLNAIAGVIATAMFFGVLYGDGLDPYMQGTYEWLLAHPGVTSLMAFSPLACSLLVGYGYASRARRRKAAAAKREELLAAARAARASAAAAPAGSSA